MPIYIQNLFSHPTYLLHPFRLATSYIHVTWITATQQLSSYTQILPPCMHAPTHTHIMQYVSVLTSLTSLATRSYMLPTYKLPPGLYYISYLPYRLLASFMLPMDVQAPTWIIFILAICRTR